MYTFLRTYDDNEVSVKVTGSKMLKNGLVVPGTFKTRTPNRAIATKFEQEIPVILLSTLLFWGVGAYLRLGALKVLFQGGVVGVGTY